MRQFVVLGHSAAVTPDFTLKDLPGSAGRLDVLCRCVNSAFMTSHGLREDVRLHLVLQDRYTLRFEGRELQYVNPDERSTGALIKKALEKAQVRDVSDEQVSTPGIYIQERGFNSLLTDISETGTVVELHEDGIPLPDADLPPDPIFVLSDHQDFTEREAELLSGEAAQRVSVGPTVLHADHTMVVAHNWLDTAGYTRY